MAPTVIVEMEGLRYNFLWRDETGRSFMLWSEAISDSVKSLRLIVWSTRLRGARDLDERLGPTTMQVSDAVPEFLFALALWRRFARNQRWRDLLTSTGLVLRAHVLVSRNVRSQILAANRSRSHFSLNHPRLPPPPGKLATVRRALPCP